MKDKIEVIVLAESPYGESSHLLHVISRDFGYLSFVVKNSQKITAKNRILPFTHAYFYCDYKENKTIFPLQNRDIIRCYYRQDLRYLAYLNLLGELIQRCHNDFINETFSDFLCVLNNEDISQIYKFACFLLAKLLSYQGLQPYLDGCVQCNQKKIKGFSIKKGGFVCENHCYEEDYLEINSLKKIRHIFLVDRKKISQLAEDFTIYDLSYLIRFFEQHIDIQLRSYPFFCNCFSL